MGVQVEPFGLHKPLRAVGDARPYDLDFASVQTINNLVGDDLRVVPWTGWFVVCTFPQRVVEDTRPYKMTSFAESKNFIALQRKRLDK